MPSRKQPRGGAVTSRPRGRRPGASRTRDDILAAARTAFAEHGFNGGTVRDIADRAGVDAALVMHFFGSKEQLFASAMELPFDSEQVVAAILDGPRDELGARMITAFLGLWEDPDVGPRMLGLIRSATTYEAAARRLRNLVDAEILRPVAEALETPDSRLRADLVGAQLVGLGFTRYVLGLEPLASADRETLQRLLAPSLQSHLTGGIQVSITPIGWVRSPRAEPVDDDWDSITATIVLDAGQFGPEAVRGLDEFSHVEVVYLFDRVDPGSVATAARHPRGETRWPEVGIFAQRAKDRPNRLGVSVCRLVGVDGLELTVHALDAIDGTPVLDIKPCMTEFAPRGTVSQPAWSHELMTGYRSGSS
jgi:tRNA-Thr(GGU) m(6)t(6)A37 methyltransferase TsaA